MELFWGNSKTPDPVEGKYLGGKKNRPTLQINFRKTSHPGGAKKGSGVPSTSMGEKRWRRGKTTG